MNATKRSPEGVLQLMRLIPDELLEGLSQEMLTDSYVKKLPAKTLFKLIIFTTLSTRNLSLRQMEECYGQPFFQALERTSSRSITHSAIAQRIAMIRPEYFERIYEHLYDQYVTRFNKSGLKNWNIKRYDSTMISVATARLEAMRVGPSKTKNQIKYTTEYLNDLMLNVKLFTDQAYLSEETALADMIRSGQHHKKDVIVFDNGLKKREFFCELSTQHVNFITRVPDKTRYEIVQEYDTPEETANLIFTSDLRVYLYRTKAKKVESKTFRLIIAQDKLTGKSLFLVTNMTRTSAHEIARIYRLRWNIEVLFRFMKQEMNLSHLLSYDPTSIKAMIYCCLIATMLVLLYKKINNISSFSSAKRLFFMELLVDLWFEFNLPAPGFVQPVPFNMIV